MGPHPRFAIGLGASLFLSVISTCGAREPAPAPASEPIESAPSREFPETIRIKTPRQTFNLFFYFVLDDRGRIWVKSIPGASKDTEHVAPDWRLFLGNGLPHDPARTDFVSPRRIEAINADLDELMAVSDDHRHYSVRWFENPVFKEETPAKTWTDLHGWPVARPFVWDARVADNRGWAIGRRTRNFVLFEDVVGKTFDGGGGLSSYYFLPRDGTAIIFSDSGLPPDFSHTICGPDRSRFVAEAMQVSGDTIFVINAYGEMRTRMVDFDTNGADTMFFVYTYDRNDLRPNAIALPAEDWFAHKAIPLEGRAQISTGLAIVLTGKHNKDRELRVAGYDRDRRSGYYFKPIFDQALGSPVRQDRDDWKFESDEEAVLDPRSLLDPADTDPDPTRAARREPVPIPRFSTESKPARRVSMRDMVFKGQLRVAGAAVHATVEVSDFNFACSPATLRLSAEGDSIEMVLHTVEKWYHLPRLDPGRDGTPQEFQATLEIPRGAFAAANPVLQAAVRLLAPYHLDAFAFFAQATEDYLEVVSQRGGSQIEFFMEREGRGYPSLASAKRDALRRDGFTARARAADLQMGMPLARLTPAHIPLLLDKMGANTRAARQLERAADAPLEQDDETPAWLSPAVLGGLRFASRPWMIELLMPALPFRNVSTEEAAYYAKNLSTNMPPLLKKSRALKETLLFHSHRDLEYALMLIDTRIAAYWLRLDELKGRWPARSFTYCERLADYWAPFRFGEREATIVGVSTAAAACRAKVSDGEIDQAILPPASPGNFSRRPGPPGIVVEIVCPDADRDGKLGLRIIPTQLEGDLFRASLRSPARIGSAANPVLTPARMQVDHATYSPGTQALLDAMFSSKDQAISQEAPVRVSVQEDRFRISRTSFAVEWQR